MWYTSPVLIGIVAALLSGSGVGAYQMYRRKSRPFIVQESLDTVMQTARRVPVPSHVTDATREAVYIRHLQATSKLGDIDSAAAQVADIIHAGPSLLSSLESAVDRLEAPASDGAIVEAISGPLSMTFFDTIIDNAVFAGRVSFPTAPGSTVKVHIFRVSDEGGSYYLVPPDKPPITFARSLDRFPMLENGLKPFVAAVESLDSAHLKNDFLQLANLVSREIQAARTIKADLDALLEQNARWKIGYYFANYGETAMLLLTNASIEVRRRNGRKDILQVDANLRNIGDRTEQGRQTYRDGPLLIAPGGEARAVALTAQTQDNMTNGGSPVGDELRGRFQSDSSEVRVVFTYITAGLRTTRVARTPWRPFSAEP